MAEGVKLKYPCKTFPYKKYPVDYGYPCKNEEKTTHEGSFTDLSGQEMETGKEKKVDIKNGKYYPEALKRKYSYPCFRTHRDHRRQRNDPNFTFFWYKQFLNEWERERENFICIYPPMKDSYEILCGIPICKPIPPVHVKKKDPFNSLYCVFCDRSLYNGGAILDLHETVPAIRRQSDEREDDIAYRIGIRTRITVHKSCYFSYIKKPVTYLTEYDAENSCIPEGDDTLKQPSEYQSQYTFSEKF